MKFYTVINKVFLFIGLASYNLIAYAGNASTKNEVARSLLTGATETSPASTPGLGKITGGLSSFGEGLAQLIKTLAVLGGIALLLFSIQLYIKHRKNPMETSLSMVIMVFFIGLVLIALSFTPIKF